MPDTMPLFSRGYEVLGNLVLQLHGTADKIAPQQATMADAYRLRRQIQAYLADLPEEDLHALYAMVETLSTFLLPVVRMLLMLECLKRARLEDGETPPNLTSGFDEGPFNEDVET